MRWLWRMLVPDEALTRRAFLTSGDLLAMARRNGPVTNAEWDAAT